MRPAAHGPACFFWEDSTAWNAIFVCRPIFPPNSTAWKGFFALRPYFAISCTAWNAFFALKPFFVARLYGLEYDFCSQAVFRD